MSVIIKKFVVGALETNCYMLYNNECKDAMIIDPGAEIEKLYDYIKKEHLKLKYIVATHGHPDHIMEVSKLRKLTSANFYINEKDRDLIKYLWSGKSIYFNLSNVEEPSANEYINEGYLFKIGDDSFKVIETPGHTPGGICIFGASSLFSGDTLFYNSIGRTDFFGGDEKLLIKSITAKLFVLPENTVVYPGHGPDTTIGNEKSNNYYLNNNCSF